jgi:hypothetical protein
MDSPLYVQTGAGWDRHMFAMRVAAESKGEQLDLFNDTAYKVTLRSHFSFAFDSVQHVITRPCVSLSPDFEQRHHVYIHAVRSLN